MQVHYARLVGEKVGQAWAPELLFIPENGLNAGCTLFRELWDWARTLTYSTERKVTAQEIALAAYDGGKGGNDPAKNWPLRNGKYAREVVAKYAMLTREGSQHGGHEVGSGPMGEGHSA
jgi:soluble lytic murein transglycosylase-like protein